ncbi:MAG: transposase [Chlorobiales bacterium]|nr:transposase [Chlorobiales bacterium]
MKEKQTRRRYSKQFRTDAVELVLRSNKTVVEIAGDLGIRAELLYRWKSEYQAKQDSPFSGNGHLKDPEAERFRKLERELQAVKEERDILKKALAVFSRNHQ